MLNFDDPFDYKLIVKKYGNWMVDLAAKGKTKEQIRAMVMLREQERFATRAYEVGDCVLVITSKLNGYVGVVEGISNNNSYSVRFEFEGGMLEDKRVKSGTYQVPANFIMGKIDPYYGKTEQERSPGEAIDTLE